MKVKGIETLACDAGWRNYHYVKLTTDSGIVGWSEFDEGFGAPGVSTVIQKLAARVIGQPVSAHERIYAELYGATRPASGGIIALAMAAIENALLDAKAKALGVPVYELLGGKIRDHIRVYWSHCATWRINHPHLYPPAIRDLEGVKALGREVREKGFGALKTNIFLYDADKKNARGWRPGFGVPFSPELNVEREVLRNLVDASGSDARWRRARRRYSAGPQLQRQDGRLSEDPARDRASGYFLGRDRQLQSRRRSPTFAATARIPSARAKRCWDCASSCRTFRSRRWTSRSSIRHGTACGNR